ncbi:MAG: thiamine phosphate synthase, partial [Caulobacteraceae bacterium]
MEKPDCRLYLITPPAIPDLAAFARRLEEALGAGDVGALQLRLKDLGEPQIEAAANILGPIARARGAALILNDRPDLAARLGCD